MFSCDPVKDKDNYENSLICDRSDAIVSGKQFNCTASKNQLSLKHGQWIVPCVIVNNNSCNNTLTTAEEALSMCKWGSATWIPNDCRINSDIMDESLIFRLGDKLSQTAKYRYSSNLMVIPSFLKAAYRPTLNEVSIVTHMSSNKLNSLHQLVDNWDGPISVSVFKVIQSFVLFFKKKFICFI